MKSEEEIMVEIANCKEGWVGDKQFFDGWIKALEWVLK